MNEAQANYKKAADDAARYKQLVDKDEISRQTYDQAEQTAAAAKATVAAQNAAVAEARHNAARGRSRHSAGASQDPAGRRFHPIRDDPPAAGLAKRVASEIGRGESCGDCKPSSIRRS